MYCQQRIFAFLHALLGVISNATQENLPLTPPQKTEADKPLAGCSNSLASSSNYVVVSEAHQPEGPGCTITLGHPLQWRPAASVEKDVENISPVENGADPVVKLTLTIANIEGESVNLEKCHSLLEELILEGPRNLLQQQPQAQNRPLSASQRGDHLTQINSTAAGLRPRHSHEESPKEIPKKKPSNDPHSLGYHGILEYLLEKEKGKRTCKRTIEYLNVVAMARINHRESSVRRNPHGLDPNCEDIYKLLSPEKEQCMTCHPETNVVYVNESRRLQKAKELDVFYKICAVLGVAVMVATLLYISREIYRRLRLRYSLLQGLSDRNQPARGMAMKKCCSIPADGMTTLMPEASRVWGKPSQACDVVAEDINVPSIAGSATQQRYRRLPPFQRNTRRKAQDIFDLGPSQACTCGPRSEERIPVLPPAPNASVRSQTGIWQAQKGRRSIGNVEAEGNPHSKAVLF
ncbi:uncharacterized protein BO97DRAFT_444650 [Aspergillus homomorphus CBS 101889]|uniref:Uncharacterized protein n=1 Tax=Aspergillus homomorphus (strain CBS 101889) TaxID=1450537 RepID=A0A395HSP8_ASPHC|nr:hypothetical protein BO97DRAFT_444650 [Aspergillus homomorphus CBS 101889]RAL10443.1 hypothetical protein BO97DRAFT_444650 [Aspergillus homomorphus CBS 101889]